MEARVRVRVDEELCHGHQMCAISAPEVFGSDDYGNAVVLIDGPIPTALEAATRRAEANCPERAVIITAAD
jgi:ferredoxin